MDKATRKIKYFPKLNLSLEITRKDKNMNVKDILKNQGFRSVFTTRRYIRDSAAQKDLDEWGVEYNFIPVLDNPEKIQDIRKWNLTHLIAPYGGEVEIEITNTKTGETATGRAACSLKERFVKKVGIHLALERAIEQLKDKPVVSLSCQE